MNLFSEDWLQSYCQDWDSNLYHQDHSEILFVNQVLLKHPSPWTSPPLVSYFLAPTIWKACLGFLHWKELLWQTQTYTEAI